jgi:hypothetical protein
MGSVMYHRPSHNAGELNLNICWQRAEGVADNSYIAARHPWYSCMEMELWASRTSWTSVFG